MLPRRFILTRRPREYLKQGFSHCGAYSAKAILSAFGKDVKKHPKDYHPSRFGKITGISYSPSQWAEVLSAHGVQASYSSAMALGNRKKIEVLKSLLASNTPVMISIGNGYLPDGRYNALRAFFIGHWITLWGYDDGEEVFYVYDSCIPKNRYTSSIPIGNTVRTYEEILRDWKGSITSKILFWLHYPAYFYIKIHGVKN